MAFYTEDTLRRKAHKIGFHVEKGFQHDDDGNYVSRDWSGKISGYQVKSMEDGSYVYGSNREGGADFIWTLDDVENFLRDAYKERGLDL